jgi:hypothetical protein
MRAVNWAEGARRWGLVGVRLLLATWLAACGGAAASPSAPGAPSAAAPSAAPAAGSAEGGAPGSGMPDVCAKLTIGAVMATVGGTDPKGTQTHTDDHSDCAYTFSTPSTSGPVGWQVDIQVWDASAWSYQLGLPSDNRSDVIGVGDEAFVQGDTGTRDMWIRKGDTVISITVPDRDGADKLMASISDAALAALAA